MAQCISQHNFVSDLDKDLEVGSFNIVFSGHHSLYYSLFLPPKNNTKGRRADYTFLTAKLLCHYMIRVNQDRARPVL